MATKTNKLPGTSNRAPDSQRRFLPEFRSSWHFRLPSKHLAPNESVGKKTLRPLGVLGVSAVSSFFGQNSTAEYAEVAQRKTIFPTDSNEVKTGVEL